MSSMRTLIAVALLVAGWSTARAATANGGICDTGARVGHTTYYYCSSGLHNAVDSSNGTCSVWNHRGMIVGSRYYTFTGGCANTCSVRSTCNGGAGNYVRVTGSSGWTWSQMHINKNGSSYSKTCDRCPMGLVGSTGNSSGAHIHSDNRQYGTKKTAWYRNVGTTCGTNAYCGRRIGVPTL
jgi:hypothetical protein